MSGATPFAIYALKEQLGFGAKAATAAAGSGSPPSTSAPPTGAEPVRKTGILAKQGEKDKDKWQDRQIDLSNKGLRIEAEQFIAAGQLTSSAPWSTIGVEHGLEVVTTKGNLRDSLKGNTVYHLKCASSEDLDGWLAAFESVIGRRSLGNNTAFDGDDIVPGEN